jgi:hypothetical protein
LRKKKHNYYFVNSFQKSREQLQRNLPEPLEIENMEIHRIYNPKFNTMSLGRFFVHKGIWLKKKWDMFKTRKDYRMVELPSNDGNGNKASENFPTSFEKNHKLNSDAIF